MIKSDKEKKKVVCIKATCQMPSIFANVFLGLAITSERKNTPLEGFEPESKVKLQVRYGLHLNHQTTNLPNPEPRHLLNMLLFYVTGGKQKD